MSDQERLDKLVGIVAELYNVVADLTEGGNFMAQQRLRAVTPALQELLQQK